MSMQSSDYKKGQQGMFNRIYDATVAQTDDDSEAVYLIIKELNKIREEIQRNGNV